VQQIQDQGDVERSVDQDLQGSLAVGERSMICPRKSPHGSTFEVVLKRSTLARIGSERTAHLAVSS
jgi:hypothetical protein